MDVSEIRDQALERYKEALARERELRKHWVSLGKPITGEGGATGRVEVVHPLLAELRQAEAHSDRLGRALLAAKKVKGSGGRPQGASSAPDRGEPPRVLRAIQ